MVLVLAALAALAGSVEPAAAGTPIVRIIPNGRVASVQDLGRARAMISHRRGNVVPLEAISFNAQTKTPVAMEPVNWPTDG
jgi:hypothetical protein